MGLFWKEKNASYIQGNTVFFFLFKTNLQNLDLSYKMDLDFGIGLEGKNENILSYNCNGTAKYLDWNEHIEDIWLFHFKSDFHFT